MRYQVHGLSNVINVYHPFQHEMAILWVYNRHNVDKTGCHKLSPSHHHFWLVVWLSFPGKWVVFDIVLPPLGKNRKTSSISSI